jgi:uncharacterized protein YxeA
MDEEPKTAEETQETQTPTAENATFAPIPVGAPKGKISKKAIIGVIILIVFIIAGFFIFKGKGTPEESPLPSPVVRGETAATQTPTPTPEAVDKSKISVEIQNGTGITGEAAYLKDTLKSLGYADFKVGNASSTDNITTSVTFAKDVPSSAQTEIANKLKEVYKEVDVKTSGTATTDVLVITGLRKGTSPKPTATATTKPTTTPTGSPSATASPTPTPTGQ